jgi:hypothetical protein
MKKVDMEISEKDISWLLESTEPWTRYRSRVELLDQAESDPQVQTERRAMLADQRVQALVADAGWPGYAIQRHNDAKHSLHELGLLVDFGLHKGDAAIDGLTESVLAHQSAQGAFQSPVSIATAFGGSGKEEWTWLNCDAPLLLHALLALGVEQDERIEKALNHLAELVEENGWRCSAAPEVGKFRGPGRRADPCPIATLYGLKALAQAPEMLDSRAARLGAEMLLHHWEVRKEQKYYLFAMGSDFCKIKYPFVWYDILHVVDVLSRFPFVYSDTRFQQLFSTLVDQADGEGRYTAGSMYLAWKGWSFADKKMPSPWLTFLVKRIQKRVIA